MTALADNDGVKTFAHQLRERAVRHMHERTGGFDHIQPERASAGFGFV